MWEPEDFNAVITSHGLYSPEQFVLRLSPKNHALMDKVTAGEFDPGNIGEDMLRAYSTYLHETIHWWQHSGSTSGFVLSMCYPLELHSTQEHIRTWCSLGEPTKPISAAALEGELSGVTSADDRQAAANMVLNYTLDFENFRRWLLEPENSEELNNSPYFLSPGHCFGIVYNDLMDHFSRELDPDYQVLPRPDNRMYEIHRLGKDKVMGYYEGTPIYRRPVGVRELFEGQACFAQMQFLTCSGTGDGKLKYFRDTLMLHGVYEKAFIEFFKRAEIEPPDDVLDPLVGLFLLVCDVAINPMEGLLCDIASLGDFVNDADPGMRFMMLTNAVRDHKEKVVDYLEDYSAEEYENLAEFLSACAGFLPPRKGWDVIQRLVERGSPLTELMEEHRTLKFQDANVVIRVLISHFISFTIDKAENPHFFCWPGVWKATMKKDDWISALWLKHLSLFSDQEHDDGIFPRRRAGATDEDLHDTFIKFFTNILVSDLTRQWVLKDGPFDLNFKWLSENRSPEFWLKSAGPSFEALFGVKLDDIRVSRGFPGLRKGR